MANTKGTEIKLTSGAEYWFFPTVGNFQPDSEELNQVFNKVAAEGYEFVGVDNLSRNVFRRKKSK